MWSKKNDFFSEMCTKVSVKKETSFYLLIKPIMSNRFFSCFASIKHVCFVKIWFMGNTPQICLYYTEWQIMEKLQI